MTPDRARAAVAAVIVAGIPETMAEKLAGWTEAQWQGFIAAIGASSPGLWAGVETHDVRRMAEASELADQVADLVELGPPPLPLEPALLGLELCPTCQGCGAVPPGTSPPPTRALSPEGGPRGEHETGPARESEPPP